MSVLEVQKLEAAHGLLQAVRGVTLMLTAGEIVALVGANGAGKTTFLRTLAGAHRAASGTIRWENADITHTSAHERVARGISLVPEGRRLFPTMSVVENLILGQSARRIGDWNIERVADAFPQLKPLWKKPAGTLSGGQQQACAIGRALMANPALLLLDEVSLGLSPKAVDGVYESLDTLKAAGVTMILVEQELDRALRFAGRIVCLLEGSIVAEGLAGSLSRAEVMGHYFGTHRARASESHAA